jgi:hypothetical protein
VQVLSDVLGNGGADGPADLTQDDFPNHGNLPVAQMYDYGSTTMLGRQGRPTSRCSGGRGGVVGAPPAERSR